MEEKMFNISNTVCKTWFILRKFNFEAILRKRRKNGDWNKSIMGGEKIENKSAGWTILRNSRVANRLLMVT